MLHRKQPAIAVALVLAAVLLPSTAAVAQRPCTDPPRASNAPEDDGYSLPAIGGPKLQDRTVQQLPDAPTLKANVELVNLYFTVKDKHGALIPGLRQDDFRVSEDGKPQAIKYFAAESNQPLTLGLLIDTSASQTAVLPMEKEVGAAFLRDVLTPKDLAFLINFDIAVALLQDYTNDADRLRRAMEQTRINDGGGSGAAGIAGAGQGTIPVYKPKGTLLYDAVYLASREKLQRESGRKALILLTDGGDEGSDEKLQNAIEAAQRSEVIVYVILIADRANFRPGVNEMRKLTEQTGGRMIDVGNDLKKLRQAFDAIGNELRSQYLIGYTPANAALDGKFRKIELTSSQPDLKLQVRKGYFAPKD